MRHFTLFAAVAGLVITSVVHAQQPTATCTSGSSCASGGCSDSGLGLLGGKQRCSRLSPLCGCRAYCGSGGSILDGMDPSFNCGCQGSYKYPVRPLYTYFWPGMYSHQLITNYHSPWRFPPLKPYEDEKIFPQERIDGETTQAPSTLPDEVTRTASKIRFVGDIEPMSEKLNRYYR